MESLGIGIAVSAGLTAIGAVGYRVLRPRYPIKVKCHFCGETTKVPYENRNCWDCLDCEQYNGFLPDGDYNKPIPAQYYESMNHPVAPEQVADEPFNSSSDILCSVCSRNQLMKVKQIANFVPQNEVNYDLEVEAYKYHLEQIYHLCRMCEHKVKHALARQDVELLQQFEEANAIPPPESSFSDWEDSFNCSAHIACRLSSPWHVRLLRLTAVMCAVSLLLASSCQLLAHSEIGAKPAHYLPGAVIAYVNAMYASAISLALLGTFCTLLAIYVSGKERLTITDAIGAFTWVASMLLHSYIISKILKISDRYLIQCCVGSVCTAVALWNAAVPRFEKPSKFRIRKKRRRYEMDSSMQSSTHGSPTPSLHSAARISPPQAPRSSASVRPASPDHDPFGKFETLSLGKMNRVRPRSVNAAFGGSGHSPPISEPAPSTSRGNLESLRTPRQLIQPSRFRPSHLTAPPSPFSSGRSSVSGRAGSIFSQSQRSVVDDRAELPSTSRGSHYSAGHADPDAGGDRASVFSVPRSTVVEEEAMEDSDHSSSPCPVDTTSCTQATTTGGNKRRRSVLVQIVLGVSIGANVFLLLYFCTDYTGAMKQLAQLFKSES